MQQLELRFDTNSKNPEPLEHMHGEYENCECWTQRIPEIEVWLVHRMR